MNWKKLVVMGLVLVAAAVLVEMIWGTVTPSQAAQIAVQQADDTTASQVATRAVSESVGVFYRVCDLVKYAGYLLILAGLILLGKKSMEKKEEKGGEAKPAESAYNKENK